MRILLVGLVLASFAIAATPVYTSGYSNTRTNANNLETSINQATISRLHKLGTFTYAGDALAQPLYAPSIAVGGVTYNLLIVATNTNDVYAFNADLPGSTALWHVNMGATYTNSYGITAGIVGTPVIDPSSGVIYLVYWTTSGVWNIAALNISDGTAFHAAVAISASFTWNTTTTNFQGINQFNRPALLLLGNIVYTAFGSSTDEASQNWAGWIIAYNKTTLVQTATYNVSPSAVEVGGGNFAGGQASFWMGGGGLSSDGTSIWGISSNDSAVCANSASLAESFLQLTTSLTVTDLMQAPNCVTLDANDEDLGSGRAMIVGNWIIGGGKDGRIWILTKGSMTAGAQQIWNTSTNGQTNGLTINGYAWGSNQLFVGPGGENGVDYINMYSCTGTLPTACNTTPTRTSAQWAYAAMSYTSNALASSSGLLWVEACIGNATAGYTPGTFLVYNPNTMTPVFTDASINSLGSHVPPVVVNGVAYVTSWATTTMPSVTGSINVYSLAPRPARRSHP